MAIPKDDNPFWRLYILYFSPCEIMHQHHRRLKSAFFSDKATQGMVGEEFNAFTMYWFASLFVVVEGWKSLKINEPQINEMVEEHWVSLRLFRNAVFHYQPEDRKHRQFFDPDNFNWAEKLHYALRDFFKAQGWMSNGRG